MHWRPTLTLAPVLATAAALGCSAPPERAAPPPRPRPIVVIETDFGSKDDAPALLKGVVLSIARDAQVVDLTEDVPPYDIVTGAQDLEDAPGIFPAGTVFVVVIDPGVGTARKSIAVELKNGNFLIGPDNGVLSLAMEKYGVQSVREITNPAFQRKHESETFHGRDVFSPCGAHVAIGSPPFAEIGPELKEWIKLPAPPVEVHQPSHGRAADGDVERITAHVAKIDDPYGNLWTDVTVHDLGSLAEVGTKLVFQFGDKRVLAPLSKTFGDVPEGQPLAYFNSRNRLSLALNMGNAAEKYGVKRGDKVTITRESTGEK